MPRGAIQITLRLSSRGWFSIALRHLCLSIQAIVIVNLYQTQTIAFHTLGMAKTDSRLWKIKTFTVGWSAVHGKVPTSMKEDYFT